MTAEEKENKIKQKKPVVLDEDGKRPAPDGGYGWIVLMSAFFVSFILDGVMYSFGIILDAIKEDFQVADSVSNLLSSLNTGFLFCSGPIVSGLANTFGCRSVVMGGAVVTAAMYMGTVFSPSIYLMMGLYGVIGGVSTGCTYIASLIIIAEWFDKKRGIATGITMAGSGVGSFVFAPVVGKLIDAFGWRFAMSICACIILQCAVFGALLRPLNPISNAPPPKKLSKKVELKNLNDTSIPITGDVQDMNENSKGKRALQTFSGSMVSINAPLGYVDKKAPIYERNKFLRITIGILKEMTDFKLLVQNAGFFCITISNFFLFTGYFTPFLYITKIAQKNGIQKAKASFLISIIGIVNIPARMIFGFVADRKIISAINLNTGSVFVATVPLFLYIVMQYFYWSQILFSVIFAIGIAGMNCLTTMYLCDLVGLSRFSNATGIINLFRGFGCFLGPFLAGAIANRFGEVECFFFSAICFSIGLLLTVLVSFSFLFKRCCKRSKKSVDEEKNEKNAEETESLNRT